MVASQSSDVETVTLLIEQGAYVDLQDEKDNTALHNAVTLKKLLAHFLMLEYPTCVTVKE